MSNYSTKTEEPWTCHPDRSRGIYYESTGNRSLGYARGDKLNFCRVLMMSNKRYAGTKLDRDYHAIFNKSHIFIQTTFAAEIVSDG